MGIKHRADSGFRKFWVLGKLCLGGQVRSFEMPYVSYPRPLAASLTKTTPRHDRNEAHTKFGQLLIRICIIDNKVETLLQLKKRAKPKSLMSRTI
jgi:hypothetical protein